MKKVKGFFFIDGFDVMFLNGTSFNKCKQVKNDLTITEYNKAIGKKEVVKKKSSKVKKEDKSFKIDLDDK
jgi:hypothetical protein